MKVSANGLELECDERGDPGAPVILLSMGLGAALASILPRWWRSRNK